MKNAMLTRMLPKQNRWLLAVMTLLFIFCLNLKTQAQIITIPDVNFVTYLQTNFPSAMNGNQLDTQDASVTSTTILLFPIPTIPSNAISDFTGLGAFINLQELYIGGHDLTSFVLPSFSNLLNLHINDCPTLTQFPANLPASLQNITAVSCANLATVPFIPSLVTSVHLNQCTGLMGIASLPLGLNVLSLSGCSNISSIPVLPTNLFVLDVSFCSNLTSLPTVPNTLNSLHIDFCPAATVLPSLPNALQYYSCQNNGLTTLPVIPVNLIELNCTNNALSCLARLPDSLAQLSASGNSITCIPNVPTTPFGGSFTSDIGTTLCNGMQSSFTGQPVSCTGACDGDLAVISSSGVALDYFWGTGFQDLNNASGASMISGLCAGTYDVYVSPSAGGCTTYLSTVVNQPSPQQLGQPTIDPMSCSNDSTWVYYPGNPPFSFQWSTGAIADSVYLPVGNYTVTVAAGGCGVLPATFTVAKDTIAVSVITTNISCNGFNDGSITATATGGNPPYQYAIDGAAWQASGTFTNLPPGLHAISAIDVNVCVGVTVFSITQPAPITINTSTADATCGLADGSITINVSGGNAPFLFSIDNGITTQPSNVFNNVASGFYTVSVEDANGCFVYQHVIVSSIGGPVINNLVPTNTSCFNSNDGSITVNVTGGTLPYQYSADTGLTQSASNILMSLNAGFYMVAVADAGGCWTTANTVITSPAAISIFNTVNNVTCFGGNDGSFTVMASSGVSPYQYSIDGGTTYQTSNVFDTLVAGNYTVTVMDINGCTNSTNTTIMQPSQLMVSIGPDITICNGTSVNLCPITNGGTPSYTYLWNTGSIAFCNIITTAGTYSITIVDQNGCIATSTVNITVGTGFPFLSIDNIVLPTCGMCDGSATAVITGTTAASYVWTPGLITTPTNSQLCENANHKLVVMDINGCIDSVSFHLSCRSVWPGDANNDGQADNTDLLAIGIAYGAYGPPRPAATINWQAEFGIDWSDSLPSGTNFKHIDCDGNGLVTDLDTTAIIQNFGLIHPLHPALITSILTDPPFYFDLQIDSTNIDTILQIPIMLGTAAMPADSIYGIAFTVSYDTALVKADSMTINFNNCWMNSAIGHTLGIGINDALNGRLYAAVTRTSHTDTSGYGELGRLGVVTVDNISARMSSLRADTLIFTLSDVLMITHDEQYKTVNIINDTLILNDNTVSIAEHNEPFALNVYPNPANRFMFLDYDAQLKTPVITVRTLLNEEITINYKASYGKAIVDLGTIANGIYLLSVSTDKGIVTRKINVLKP